MVYLAAIWELRLAGPQRLEGPLQLSPPFLPAQFLFLVLRRCDEGSFSSHTSCTHPPTAASLRLPFRGLGPESKEQAEERLLGLLEALWAGENLVSSDPCPRWLLLLSPDQPAPGPCSAWCICSLCCLCCRETGGEDEEQTLRAPLLASGGDLGGACGSNFLTGLLGAQKLGICVGWSILEGFLEGRDLGKSSSIRRKGMLRVRSFGASTLSGAC